MCQSLHLLTASLGVGEASRGKGHAAHQRALPAKAGKELAEFIINFPRARHGLSDLGS